MEALTQQLGVFMAIHNQQNQRPYDLGDEDLQGDDFEEMPQQRRRDHIRYEEERRHDDSRKWESGMCTKVPEFQGSLQVEDLLIGYALLKK